MECISDCKICYNSYNSKERKPKMLFCGHTFCSICIQAILEGRVYETICPTCRRRISCSFSQLPINYSLLDLVNCIEDDEENDSDDSIVECTKHSQSIEAWCKRSELWLCKTCVQHHTHMDMTSTSDCIVDSQVALEELKTRVLKTQGDILTDMMEIIEESRNISHSTNESTEEKRLIYELSMDNLKKYKALSLRFREFQKRALKYHLSLSSFTIKLDNIKTVGDWFQTEDILNKRAKVRDFLTELKHLESLKCQVKFFVFFMRVFMVVSW